MEQYQDEWVKGKVVSRGVRDCELRWEMIYAVASQWKRPFTVLDIGANLGYFSLRLAESFDCTVVSLEGIYGDQLQKVLDLNGNDRVLFLRHLFSCDDLRLLSDVEHFDLVLALSVMHHFDKPFPEVLSVVRDLGDVVIAENAVEPNACGISRVKESFVPDDALMLGWADSHLMDVKRPMYVMQQSKNCLRKAYVGTPLFDVNVSIVSNFDSKIAFKDGVSYDWFRGINLKTWLYFNGQTPAKNKIIKYLEFNRPKLHGDISIFNVILQGDNAVFIDALDKRREILDDEEMFVKLLLELK